MTKSFYLLVFLFIGTNCYSQDFEKLPAKPWKELVEIKNNNYNSLIKRTTDFNISLQGKYTEIDSLNVLRLIKKFDSLTETIVIKLSKPSLSNFPINFPNTNGLQITYAHLASSLEPQIAKELVRGTFYYLKSDEKRNSIFNQSKDHNNWNVLLNDEDLILIKEVYKNDFEQRLKKAENQFKYVLKNIEKIKILERQYDLWWVKNPYAVLFVPILILVLFSLFLLGRTKKILDTKIKNNWFRFTIISLLSITFLYFIIVFYLNFYDFIKLPVSLHRVRIWYADATVVIGLLPFLYLFRFVEFKIQKSSQNIFVKTGLTFLSTGLIPLACYLTLLTLIIKYSNTNISINKMYLVASQFFLILMSIASIRALISFFIFKERRLIVKNEMKLSHLRELHAKAELKSLQAHINPHFLYNALNSIASLAPSDALKTQKMAYSLSNLFKYSIDRKDKKKSTIKDEVTMVENYLDIEKIRFGDRLKLRINVEKTLENIEIPMFIIQPLVENAVKHGLSKIEGQGEIELKIEKTETGLLIAVLDNGPNFPEGLVSGHGLQTVYDLLDLSYGENASLNWQNRPHKSITININLKTV